MTYRPRDRISHGVGSRAGLKGRGPGTIFTGGPL